MGLKRLDTGHPLSSEMLVAGVIELSRNSLVLAFSWYEIGPVVDMCQSFVYASWCMTPNQIRYVMCTES